jgi:poly(3-hydroxybutyrate) depolymerase
VRLYFTSPDEAETMFSSRPSRAWHSLAGTVLLGSALGLLFPFIPCHGQEKKDAGNTQARIEKRTYDFKDARKEMEYALYVPTTYDKERKTPLMIALHGLGSNPQQIMRYKGLTDQAEKHGYIVAAPMGYNPRGWYGQPIPKKMSKADDPENLPELSEKDVMNVLGLVRKEFNIDPDRIYLMGHSMGGGGTWHLALKYPEIWAGLAPIAPAIFRKPQDVAGVKHTP